MKLIFIIIKTLSNPGKSKELQFKKNLYTYKKLRGNIILNSERLKAFSFRQGTRQGCLPLAIFIPRSRCQHSWILVRTLFRLLKVCSHDLVFVYSERGGVVLSSLFL